MTHLIVFVNGAGRQTLADIIFLIVKRSPAARYSVKPDIWKRRDTTSKGARRATTLAGR